MLLTLYIWCMICMEREQKNHSGNEANVCGGNTVYERKLLVILVSQRLNYVWNLKNKLAQQQRAMMMNQWTAITINNDDIIFKLRNIYKL